jgi:hypothetical protein
LSTFDEGEKQATPAAKTVANPSNIKTVFLIAVKWVGTVLPALQAI